MLAALQLVDVGVLPGKEAEGQFAVGRCLDGLGKVLPEPGNGHADQLVAARHIKRGSGAKSGAFVSAAAEAIAAEGIGNNALAVDVVAARNHSRYGDLGSRRRRDPAEALVEVMN